MSNSNSITTLLEIMARVRSIAMPNLHHAMCDLVYRYPDMRSGLGVWDERLLLQTTENGPRAVRVVGATMVWYIGDTLDICGDGLLYDRLIGMSDAALPSPLIEATGDTRDMRKCSIALTPFGNKALNGKANNVFENGIDEWIGGVHLTGKLGITYRDGNKLILPDMQ